VVNQYKGKRTFPAFLWKTNVRIRNSVGILRYL
jgi:hypothetical protein